VIDGHPRRDVARVGQDERVGGEEVPVGAKELREVRRVHLLLALDEQPHVER
jgi:hypothetical protein